jgi:aminoglycoside phosphotransferase (APT) family kinase protein
VDWRERFTGYAASKLPSAERVGIVRLAGMPAGASNETLAVDLEVTADGISTVVPLVLRPERPDGILAPYNVGRQFRIMRALARTAVPVPAVAWYEADAAVIGAPFYVMHRLTAETLPLIWYGGLSPRLMAAAGALAAIHRVDWRSAGLGFLLPEGADEDSPPSPIACELAAWTVRAARYGLEADPVLTALERFLRENEPRDARHALVHGDPNPGNYLFQGDRVAAVVDWELASIGDPRSDLGFYGALLSLFGGWGSADGSSVLSEAYQAMTGEDLTDLAYYEAFGQYRMAVVMGGWGHLGAGAGIARRLEQLLGPHWAG